MREILAGSLQTRYLAQHVRNSLLKPAHTALSGIFGNDLGHSLCSELHLVRLETMVRQSLWQQMS